MLLKNKNKCINLMTQKIIFTSKDLFLIKLYSCLLYNNNEDYNIYYTDHLTIVI